MIAVDTSALIAILRSEVEADAFLRVLAADDATCMSAVRLHEASMVIAARNRDASCWEDLDRLIREFQIDVVPLDRALAEIARAAFLRFGKGRHPARLNCGDCAAYALAKFRRIPLLFKGGDFARTNITAAVPAA